MKIENLAKSFLFPLTFLIIGADAYASRVILNPGKPWERSVSCLSKIVHTRMMHLEICEPRIYRRGMR